MNRNTYQPLLSEQEISQRNAEREEALSASLAARAPAEFVSLVKHQDGTERLLRGESADTLPPLFGVCDCRQGRDPCTCGAGWISLIAVRPKPAQPSARSWLLADFVIALVLVASIAAVVGGAL